MLSCSHCQYLMHMTDILDVAVRFEEASPLDSLSRSEKNRPGVNLFSVTQNLYYIFI